MKGALCFVLALFGMLAIVSAVPWEGKKCIDITTTLPCEGKPNGDFHICNFCEHGYFASCKNSELSITACPHEEDGGNLRLIFDNVRKTCVKKSSTCLRAMRRENDEENWI